MYLFMIYILVYLYSYFFITCNHAHYLFKTNKIQITQNKAATNRYHF
jgi:hypothetical protein